MSIGFIIITLGLAAIVAVLVFMILKLNSGGFGKNHQLGGGDQDPYSIQAQIAVKTIFNDEFREELRNRGRLHFEKIIGENAMFLQQDLQLTTSQLNEYMKQEITTKLQEEFAKYEQSIMDAKDLAIQSINKTQDAIEQQRQMLSKQVVEQLAKDKDRLITNFEQNMAQVINHYVLEAIGNQIDLNDQLDFILSNLEANKKAIIEDIVDGA
jgi:membrane-associated HD superfamily phosphohydrolase